MGLVGRCQAFMGLETNPGKEAKTSPKLSPVMDVPMQVARGAALCPSDSTHPK